MECERALATSRPVIAINKTCTNVLTRLESYKRLVSVSSRSHLGLISVSSFYVSCPSLTGDTPQAAAIGLCQFFFSLPLSSYWLVAIMSCLSISPRTVRACCQGVGSFWPPEHHGWHRSSAVFASRVVENNKRTERRVATVTAAAAAGEVIAVNLDNLDSLAVAGIPPSSPSLQHKKLRAVVFGAKKRELYA